jgi:hypothetical protein
MATSAPAIAVKHPKAPAVQSDIPAAIINIIAVTPQTMQAPDRSASLRNNAQPRAPSLSARHISPDTPPTRARTITNQIGISASACCSLVIAYPMNAKTRRNGRVWWCGACRSLRSHLSKMTTFYRSIPVAATLF